MANKVVVDDLYVNMQLGNNGITLRVIGDDEKHRGYLVISKAYIEWYHGKEQTPRLKKHLDAFIEEAERK